MATDDNNNDEPYPKLPDRPPPKRIEPPPDE